MAKGIPEGWHAITPFVSVDDAAAAIGFYKQVFGAEVAMAQKGPDGKLMHAEVRIGDSLICLNEMGPSAKALNGSPVTLNLFSADVDALFARAVKAGAKVTMPVQDMFWGDRYGQIVDPSGLTWALAQRKETLTAQQLQQRAAEAFKHV